MEILKFNNCNTCFDICFWLSTIVVPFLTFFVIRMLRPRLNISCVQISTDAVKVKIINKSFVSANNLRVEICIYDPLNNHTYHLEPDHLDFLILPAKNDNTKTFVCRRASISSVLVFEREPNYTTQLEVFNILLGYLQNGHKIRIRCHAYDSFSGLGKSFEKLC